MKLLDLFCGAGGASVGYKRAGFDVVGCDIRPMPHYPYAFIQMDAIEVLRILLSGGGITDNRGHTWYLSDFDAIHASPVCKGYTTASKTWRAKGYTYPDQIGAVRDLLIQTGKPYIIENVKKAPLKNPFALNGGLFGLNVHRVRYFETSFTVPFVLLPTMLPPVKMGRPVTAGDVIQPVGHFSGVAYAREQMGIDWMIQAELAQAIPPAFTEFIGNQLMTILLANKKGG